MNHARGTVAEGTGVMGGAEVEVVGANIAAVARALGDFFLQSGSVQLLFSALGFAFYFSKCRCAALIAITMVLCCVRGGLLTRLEGFPTGCLLPRRTTERKRDPFIDGHRRSLGSKG